MLHNIEPTIPLPFSALAYYRGARSLTPVTAYSSVTTSTGFVSWNDDRSS
jgi:hypothetical protein